MRSSYYVLSCALVLAFSGCGKSNEKPTPDTTAQVCAENLHRYQLAKQQWAQATGHGATDTPTMDDLRPFMRMEPRCPDGGTYTLGTVGQDPQCSIPAHNAAYKAMLGESTNQPPH